MEGLTLTCHWIGLKVTDTDLSWKFPHKQLKEVTRTTQYSIGWSLEGLTILSNTNIEHYYNLKIIEVIKPFIINLISLLFVLNNLL